MAKYTYSFAQYRSDQVAAAIVERKPFITWGNLSGRPVDHNYEINPIAWESQHPAWSARLAEIAYGPYDIPVYVLRSFRTIIGVLIRSHRGSELDENEMPTWHWEVDAAAASHSGYTSRAVSIMRAAIGQHSSRYGGMPDIDASEKFPVREIGTEWLIAQRLSPTQREFLGQKRGLKIPAPTRAVLVREGLLEERGFLTALGLGVARYCA